ncbi:MAG: TetR/AcrR family transcriptional regulator [Phascolarctobacterium sp.]|uniref:TetR/AcrR family transcriptional regulator n=1 Tax=Phascolarctobacterium sp. TaxID=2049039 RepID=UPI0026DB0B4A|nr:TetR/AcrR family transcriptional regulator [Phascolarctobacterium sp.]MDO4922325.1 TetR/AcrR family transcriptional regulator [Phascolarctobacterium sp.]
MDFLRAHGEEQKQQRVQQILDAAVSLYDEVGYDKITFSKIARKLDFSRINLYNYFSCKEDIFLLILMQEIKAMVDDAGRTFTKPAPELETFIERWTELLLRHQRMLAIFSIVNTIVLRYATDDVHKKFRCDMFAEYRRLAQIVRQAVPALTDDEAIRFVDFENSFALILYPASVEYKQANDITIFPTAGYGTRNFAPQFINYLRIILRGLLK